MTPEQLAEIEARASAATEGPWKVYNYKHRDYYDVIADQGKEAWTVASHIFNEGDVIFMATARQDIPALIEAVRERDKRIAAKAARIAELEALLKECADELTDIYRAQYAGRINYESEQRKFERDMDLPNRARAALKGGE